MGDVVLQQSAADYLGIELNRYQVLCRLHLIPAVLRNGQWYTTKEWLNEYAFGEISDMTPKTVEDFFLRLGKARAHANKSRV